MGARFTNWRSFARGATPQPQRVNKGKVLSDTLKSVQKSLDTIDKTQELKIETSGLLSDKEFTTDIVVDEIMNIETGLPDPVLKNIDMFKRTPVEGPSNIVEAMNPIDYYKRTTTPASSRIMINPDFVSSKNFNADNVMNTLVEKGFRDKDALNIMRNTEGVDILPAGDYALRPNEVIDPDLEYEEYLEGADKGKGLIDKFGDKIDLDKMFKDTSFNLGASDDIGTVVKEVGAAIGEAGSDVASALPDSVSASLDAIGDVALEYGGKAAEVAGQAAGAVGEALPVVSAGLGTKRIGEGLDAMADGDVLEGIEETVQGGINVASPALLAAGPYGWMVLGANVLEDMLFG